MTLFTLVVGANRGIGKAIALEAARQGHDLALVCQSNESALATARHAAEAAGSRRVVSHLCDAADADAVSNLFETVRRDHSPLTGLVNCAGFTGSRLTLAEMPLAMIDRILQVNITAAILCCR